MFAVIENCPKEGSVQVGDVTATHSHGDSMTDIAFTTKVVDGPAGNPGKKMQVTLAFGRAAYTFEGDDAAILTDKLSALLREVESKALALDIEEGNYG